MAKLTPEEVQRRRELTKKLRQGTLTYEEAVELNQILEKELEIAKEENDQLAIIAILLFLALLASILTKGK